MSWSYTMLATWEKCAARFKYKYKEGLEDRASKWANSGSNAHKKIEDYIKGEPTQLEPRMQPMFTLLQRLKDESAVPEKWLAVSEKWEPVPYKEGWLKTRMDCIEKDGSIIWEWKTGKVWDDHEQQRELYGLVGLASYPIESTQVHSYYIDLGESHVTAVRKEQQEELRKEWEARVGFMENDKVFVPRPGWYCKSCPYSRDKGGPCRFG